VTVYATATAYGITKVDTLPYTIGYPLDDALTVTPALNSAGKTVGVFVPDKMILGPGASVLFANPSAPPTDVTFDNPANVDSSSTWCPAAAIVPWLCSSGNIPAFAHAPNDSTGASWNRVRQFPVPGTYNFHSTISGAKGTIVIMTQ
jgi:plastocyanin